jgi:hypothetical protein
MHRTFIIETLLVLLGIALLIAVIKYPKDAFIKIPLGVLDQLFVRPLAGVLSFFVLIIESLGPKRAKGVKSKMSKYLEWGHDDDRSYPATEKLKVDFPPGDKHAFIVNAKGNVAYIIEDFLGGLTGKHSIDEFAIRRNGNQCMITVPKSVNFYDFLLLVMHLTGTIDEKNCIGIFKSAKLDFYVYLDPAPLNNLLGVTNQGKKFSVHMLDDDMENEQCLKLNQELDVDLAWIKQWVGV